MGAAKRQLFAVWAAAVALVCFSGIAIGFYFPELVSPEEFMGPQGETLRDLVSLAGPTVLGSVVAQRAPKKLLWIPSLWMLFQLTGIHLEGVAASPASGVAAVLWGASVVAWLRCDNRMATWANALCGLTLACMLLYAAATAECRRSRVPARGDACPHHRALPGGQYAIAGGVYVADYLRGSVKPTFGAPSFAGETISRSPVTRSIPSRAS